MEPWPVCSAGQSIVCAPTGRGFDPRSGVTGRSRSVFLRLCLLLNMRRKKCPGVGMKNNLFKLASR